MAAAVLELGCGEFSQTCKNSPPGCAGCPILATLPFSDNHPAAPTPLAEWTWEQRDAYQYLWALLAVRRAERKKQEPA
jgi:hypothetical protein